MSLIALAVPFFLFALLVEFLVDRMRGTGYYRSNDAINSLSAGILSESTGYFTKFLQYTIWGLVLSKLALFDIERSWFDASVGGVLLWILAAVLWDFCYYWNHRLGHEISILWAAHAVHHQSEDYNLSTALRQTSTSFLFSWIFYVPLFLIGFPADVLITVAAVNLIYQFWVHTQQIRRLGVLDRIFVTPSNHRVHHAQNERYIDKNYGGIFVLWDRLFGTFIEESDDEPVIFGVRKPLGNWNPFWANFQVYDYLLFDATRTRRWRDKIGIWFRRTGWRPADVAAEYPKQAVDLTRFRKYDPDISTARRRYVLAQFMVVIATALFIANAFATQGAGVVLVPCLLLWTNLYTLGLLNEDRPYAARFELIRLFVVLPLGMYALDPDLITIIPAGAAVIAIYILVSALWLAKK
ncbi:MAG: sterol desaturase family protein [Gammaproteobacteria bacterium]|nr:sterol desaturase family protein [Gammaproteobacteria bacterium]MDH5260564.1 sterol desaturase family protein [Gammaproteobacteria bacterium]MDH5582313.1 sterol desaturase family protein [Gammaproteobacteria bacterium]